MDYKIKYLPLAVQDLRNIAQYLSGFYPKTATRVLREIRGKSKSYRRHPICARNMNMTPAIENWLPTNTLCSIVFKKNSRL